MGLNNKRKLAFGGLSKRFDYRGLHPSFERRGYTYKYPHIAPGSYYREEKKKLKGVGYALSQESEELSRNLAHRAEHKLKEKAWQRSILGPGWHDVKSDADMKFGKFSVANRFPHEKTWSTPGPGTYGKDHVPHLRMEEKTRFRSFSDTPTFEFDNCMPRSINVQRKYHLPPNIYKMKSFADEIVSKVVSKRGPYDLFTGARDETSLYGHYARPRVGYEGSNVNFAGVSERLNNACNRYKGPNIRLAIPVPYYHQQGKGIFPTCGRETYPTMRVALTQPALSKPDPDKPAPNQYNPREPGRPVNVARFPFNSSVLHARPLKKIEMKPPPDRYEQFQKRKIFGNGWRSAFLSKVKRGVPLPEKTSWY